MGEKMLSVSLMTLVMFFAIDWFVRWYNSFLQKRALDKRFRTLLIRLVWIISALLFWSAMFKKGMPHGFTITHFAFALFIFSVFGFVKSLLSIK